MAYCSPVTPPSGRSTTPDPPPLYLIVGAPGVGKSTVSRLLATSFERGVHVPVDDLREMVRSGLAAPDPRRWPDDLVEQVRLARETALDMAARYRTAGFAVVLDDFVDPGGLAEYAAVDDALRVVLRPSIEVAIDRNQGRGRAAALTEYLESGIRAVYRDLDEHDAALRAAGWAVLDTTELSAEATVDRIRARDGLTLRR